MKMWRKIAKKDEFGKRNGREIAYNLRMQEMMLKTSARTYPLLDALFKHAGVRWTLSKAQQEQLKVMEKTVNETN